MERELLKLTIEQAQSIVYEGYYTDDNGNDVEFEEVEETMSDGGRWSNTYDIVIKRVSDGKFFSSYYTKGATESQPHEPYEYDDCEFTEVFPTTKTITVYN